MGAGVVWLAALGGCRGPAPTGPAALWIGGDVFVTEPSRGRLSGLSGALRGVGVVNLEGPIHEGSGSVVRAPTGIVLGQSPGVVEVLGGASIAAVTLANNHRDDHGTEGIARTRAALEAGGIAAIEESGASLTIGGLRVAFTAHLVGEQPIEGLAETIAEAGAQRDVLVAIFHTISEGGEPSGALLSAIDAAIDAGARVVAVHGSHEIGRVERRGGSVVAMGLGNLLFDCDCTDGRDALALQLDLFADGSTSAEIVPMSAGLWGLPAQRAARPDVIFDRLEVMGSSPLIRGEGSAIF